LTYLIIDFSAQFTKQHVLAGIVLQDSSPSCGNGNTDLYSQQGEVIGLGTGLFAATMLELNPDLIVVQASQLQSKQDVSIFVKNITSRIFTTSLK
jgi:uncharacterized protein YbbK (DUF523 family)